MHYANRLKPHGLSTLHRVSLVIGPKSHHINTIYQLPGKYAGFMLHVIGATLVIQHITISALVAPRISAHSALAGLEPVNFL